ncbi:lamin tail domain-containing protein [Patescibacteria group bacterium]|nr:lamin tail domain-containing protein [Patescibacteria group bacterium]
MNKNSKKVSFCLILIYGCFLNFNFSFTQEIDYVVISEIQISGKTANDEYIRLYNPTSSQIDLTGWDLKRKTKTGTEYNLLNNLEGIISSKGYFLIGPRANCGDNGSEDCYQGEMALDDEYTTNSFLAKNNTVLLYNENGLVVDKVGWGEAEDFEGETIKEDLENGQTYSRKFNNGIIQDTNNNQNDFKQAGFMQGEGADDILTPPEQDKEGSSLNSGQSVNQEDESSGGQSVTNNDENLNIIFEIVITEFLPNPEGSDKDNEFIELYNKGDTTVNIENFVLADKIGKIREFIIPKDTKINAKSYKVFYADQTGIVLNNSGDGVLLKDNQGNIISETPLSGPAKEEQSYALDKNNNWTWTLKPTPRKENIIEIKEVKDATTITEDKKSNIQKKQEKEIDIEKENDLKKDINDEKVSETNGYDFSDGIVISEIYPNPIGNDNRQENYEWIEIYNNSDREVNLKGWQIDDILNKGSKAYVITEDTIIKARNFLVFSNKQTKIVLNNLGDEINILWPDGEVVDNLKYEKAKEGFSYNWVADGLWQWSEMITPGRNNNVPNSDSRASKNMENGKVQGTQEEVDYHNSENLDFIVADITEVKDFDKYSRVKISGIVSTPVGIFSDKSFYLSGSGIQVYSYKIISKEINVGDKIELRGILSEVGGEIGLLIENDNDIVILNHDNLVEAKLISTGDLRDELVGSLVITEGQVVNDGQNLFYIDDGNGKAKIYIKSFTGIGVPDIKEGLWVTVTGQVSKTSLGYRILPRFQNDIKIAKTSGTSISNTKLPERNKATDKISTNDIARKSFWSILFFLMIALVLLDWGRMKINKGIKIIN